MRNDNPQNVIMITEKSKSDALYLKNKGNELFKATQYSDAIIQYKQALVQAQTPENNSLKVIILSNISQCYTNLDLYEDALEYTQ